MDLSRRPFLRGPGGRVGQRDLYNERTGRILDGYHRREQAIEAGGEAAIDGFSHAF